MRTSLMLAVGILSFGLSQGQVHGQVTSGKDKIKVVPIDDSVKAKFDPSVFKIDTSAKVKLTKFAPLVSIDQFTSKRVSYGILVGAYLRNYNLAEVKGATYSIYRASGSSWVKAKSGTLDTFKAVSGSAYVSVTLPLSNDAMRFKIDVSQSVDGSKQSVLPQQIFVVKYRCPDWQVFGSASGSYSDFSLLAKQRAGELNRLGFDTRISVTNKETLFDHSQSVTVYYRALNWQERSFTTHAQAKTFWDSLPTGGVMSKAIETRTN